MISLVFALAMVGWLAQLLVFARAFAKDRDLAAFFAGFACLGWAVAFARELQLLPRPPTTWLLAASFAVAWGGFFLLMRLQSHRPLPGWLRYFGWKP